MEKFYPQRAVGTHRAVRRIAFAKRQKHRIIVFKALLVKAKRDHKSFVDLSHYAAGQIADFVF